jgi:hypothetical protein
VDVEGSGETAKFTFIGEPKPDVLPDVPTAELVSEPVATKSGAVGTPAGNSGSQDGGGTASALG